MEGNTGIHVPMGTVWRNLKHALLSLILILPLFASISVKATSFPAGLLSSGFLFISAGGSGEGQDNAAAAAAPAADPGVMMKESDIYTSLLILILALAAILFLLVFISANLVNLIRVREGKEGYSFGGTMALALRMVKNRYFAIAGNFVLIIIVASFLTTKARGVGLHQGYMPDQPIKYSHALHAGKLKIDCQYCHSGASKGKNAWIPSVNVCWNCHKVVKDGPKYGTVEIAKIEDAVKNKKAIEWTRVHNVPDHAYFNHQQHVVVGGVACQKCHGPVETMEEMYQFAPLSMGWCVNCHRETEVNKTVYQKLGLFKELMSHSKKKVTAADIGAINCARCHY